MQEPNYGPWGDFLGKSLIMLDDYMPDYTDYEQFANIGVAFTNRNVVTYNRIEFGQKYLRYLSDQNLGPKNLEFMRRTRTQDTIEGLVSREFISKARRLIEKGNLEYLLPFMTSPSGVKVAEKLGLSIFGDQTVVDQLNDKIFIKELAEQEGVRILGNYTAKDKEEAVDVYSTLKNNDLPILFKSSFACGGQGNFVVRNDMELKNFLARQFEGNEPFVVEPLIDIKKTPCCLFFTDPKGGVHYLGTNEQITKKQVACVGSIFPGELPQKVQDEVYESSMRLARRIAETGYFGPFGFDFIVDHEDKPFFLEANVRINYTHCMLDMYHALSARYGLLSEFVPEVKFRNMDDVLSKIEKKDLLTSYQRGIFPFYPIYKESKVETFAVIILAEDRERVLELREKYSEIFQIPEQDPIQRPYIAPAHLTNRSH